MRTLCDAYHKGRASHWHPILHIAGQCGWEKIKGKAMTNVYTLIRFTVIFTKDGSASI